MELLLLLDDENVERRNDRGNNYAVGVDSEVDGRFSGVSSFSCLTGRSSHAVSLESSVISSFLRLPLGAGSRGVRQYVTVRVTTCRTLTLPGWLVVADSAVYSRGEKDALQGAALSGVEEYGDGTE